MKQVQLNGLTVYTGPDRDAHGQAATLIREAVLLERGGPSRVIAVERVAARVESGAEAVVHVGGVCVGIVPADITYLVPDCEHELFAAGRCRTPRCPNYYLRSCADV